jgi:hypothetical protein
METLSQFIRDRYQGEMSSAEMNRRAREVWNDISADVGETDVKHSQRITRLYDMGRDIQYARARGAHVATAHRIISFLMLVLAQSYGWRVRG